MIWRLLLKFMVISLVIGFVISTVFGWIGNIFDGLRFWTSLFTT
jgi:hypothetical protein